MKLTKMMWTHIAQLAETGDGAARALMENPANRDAAIRVLMDLARVPPQAGKPRLIMRIIAKVGQIAPRAAEIIDESSGSDADTEDGGMSGGPAGAGAGAASDSKEGGRRRTRGTRNKRTKRRRGHRRGRGTRKHYLTPINTLTHKNGRVQSKEG